jgi:hypothetical protein
MTVYCFGTLFLKKEDPGLGGSQRVKSKVDYLAMEAAGPNPTVGAAAPAAPGLPPPSPTRLRAPRSQGAASSRRRWARAAGSEGEAGRETRNLTWCSALSRSEARPLPFLPSQAAHISWLARFLRKWAKTIDSPARFGP